MSDAVIIAFVQYGAWPLAILLLALIFECPVRHFFVKHLPGLLQRVGKVSAGSASIELNPANAVERQKDAEKAAGSKSPGDVQLKEIPGTTRSPAIAALEREIHTNLERIPDNKIDVLVRALAQSRLEGLFSTVYGGIFGSQIAGLMALQARRRVTAKEAYEFYKPYEEKHPEVYKSYGFRGWLTYLLGHQLISQQGEDILITEIGDDFLGWMLARNLSQNKAF